MHGVNALLSILLITRSSSFMFSAAFTVADLGFLKGGSWSEPWSQGLLKKKVVTSSKQ